MAEMTKAEALAHMREQYPDDPQWQNYDLDAKPKGTVVSPTDRDVGFKAGSFDLGLGALLGAASGKVLSRFAGTYTPPEPPVNQAALAQQELAKQRAGLLEAQAAYGDKFDALKQYSDQVKELHLLELKQQEEARNALAAAKNAEQVAAVKAASVVTNTPESVDARTRQMQGTGGVQPEDLGTGRSRLTGWRAQESELKEGKAAAEKVLGQLQGQGLVSEKGVSLIHPGITTSSPSGVLTPTHLASEFAAKEAAIISSNLPNEIKLMALKDLYTAAKSGAGGMQSAAKSAETKLLEHITSLPTVVNPLQRAIAAAEDRLSGLGGEKAANQAARFSFGKLASKIPAALTGAGAGLSLAEANERGQTGDSLGAKIGYVGAGLESLGVFPHPIPKGIALVGGLGSTAALGAYDYFKPELLDFLEKRGIYNSSVMPK
jgi:hypothetical protein